MVELNGNAARITVAGTGYVGLSLAVLLARQNHVTAIDIVPEKLEMISSGRSQIADPEIEEALAEGGLNLEVALDKGGNNNEDGASIAYSNADFVIVATPTNYDPQKNHFDTTQVDKVVNRVLAVNKEAVIAIKSTVPVGYTESLRMRVGYESILFSP